MPEVVLEELLFLHGLDAGTEEVPAEAGCLRSAPVVRLHPKWQPLGLHFSAAEGGVPAGAFLDDGARIPTIDGMSCRPGDTVVHFALDSLKAPLWHGFLE